MQTYDISAFSLFMQKRLVRIEFPYLMSIVATVLLWYLSSQLPLYNGGANPYSLDQIAANIFYIIPFTDWQWIQPVYWTLACEFLFYVAIGIGFGLLVGSNGRVAWLLISFLSILLVLGNQIPSIILLFVIGLALFRCI